MPSSRDNDFTAELRTKRGTVRVNVAVVNSARARNFGVRIAGKGSITLTKPTYASLKSATEFMHSIADWISEHLEDAPEKTGLRAYLEKNPTLEIDGAEKRVWLETSRTDSFFVEDEKSVVFSAAQNDGDALGTLFRKFAVSKISALAERTAQTLDIPYSAISVRDQSGRWASRSSSGTLSFNWRMVLLPQKYQNYIIRHELAHVRFMDHSVSFWLWLNSFCPHAKRLDRELSKISREIFAVSLK